MNNYPQTCVTISFVAGLIVAFLFKERLNSLAIRSEDSKTERNGAGFADESSERAAPQEHIVRGIEGCIGNTPLFRIKSLSDATGCDILGKAEVSVVNLAVSSGWLMIRSSLTAPGTAPKTVSP